MRLVFISGREPAYIRNAMILKGLRANGIEVFECTDSSPTYPARYQAVLTKFLAHRNQDFDLVFIGFLGQPLVPILRKLTRKPIVFDAFLSMYDTMCFDRKRFRPDSLAGRFFHWLDTYSCERSDSILLDTDAHIDYFTETFGLPRVKFHRMFVGADESLFYPRKIQREDRKFRVFYYSSFLALHGTEYIVQAAGMLLKERDIEFVVVGRGPEHEKVLNLAQRLGADNIRFTDWIPYEQLPLEIARADICLGGHFSDIDKAKRVIAGKTYQFIAMGKPVIVGDCPANRELLTNGEDALFVMMADAEALAKGILKLRDDDILRTKIANGGYKVFLKSGNTAAIGKAIGEIIVA